MWSASRDGQLFGLSGLSAVRDLSLPMLDTIHRHSRDTRITTFSSMRQSTELHLHLHSDERSASSFVCISLTKKQ